MAQGEAHDVRVSDLTIRWQSVWDTVANYHLQITAVLTFEERHHYSMKKFSSVVTDGEKELENLQLAFQGGEHQEIEDEIKVWALPLLFVLYLVSLYFYLFLFYSLLFYLFHPLLNCLRFNLIVFIYPQ